MLLCPVCLRMFIQGHPYYKPQTSSLRTAAVTGLSQFRPSQLNKTRSLSPPRLRRDLRALHGYSGVTRFDILERVLGFAAICKWEGFAAICKREGFAVICKQDGFAAICKRDGLAAICKPEGFAAIRKRDGIAAISNREGFVAICKWDGIAAICKWDGFATICRSTATPATKILTCLWLERGDVPVMIVLFCLTICVSTSKDR